jgi:hypothetical protein
VVRRPAALAGAALDDVGVLEPAEPLGEKTARDSRQSAVEIVEVVDTRQQLPDDERRPTVRQNLARPAGEHHHAGPGIRQVTSGYMTYVLPERTVVYGPGDFFFESGDVTHTAQNKTDAPMVHVLFEILPADHKGPSIMPAKH